VAATPEQVRHALLGIASGGDWDVREQQGGIEFAERRASATTWKAKIRVSWEATASGCDIHLDGRIAGLGPVQSRHLLARMGVLRAALEHELSPPAPT
jgi:hypothetical protein